jgi:hypothetical protein
MVLVRAIDDFVWYVGQAGFMSDFAEIQDPDTSRVDTALARQTVVEGARKFALEFKRYKPQALQVLPLTQKAAATHSARLRQLRDQQLPIRQ